MTAMSESAPDLIARKLGSSLLFVYFDRDSGRITAKPETIAKMDQKSFSSGSQSRDLSCT